MTAVRTPHRIVAMLAGTLEGRLTHGAGDEVLLMSIGTLEIILPLAHGNNSLAPPARNIHLRDMDPPLPVPPPKSVLANSTNSGIRHLPHSPKSPAPN